MFVRLFFVAENGYSTQSYSDSEDIYWLIQKGIQPKVGRSYHLIMSSTAKVTSISPHSHLQRRLHPKVNSLLGSVAASSNNRCHMLFRSLLEEGEEREREREGYL